MKSLLTTLSVLLVILTSGCIKTNEDKTREQLVGTWEIVGHCDPIGRVFFREDGGGQVNVNDECLVGDDCSNFLGFDWTLSDNTVVVNYDFSGFSGIICDDVVSTADEPPSETFTFTKDTEVITVYGYVFQK